MVPSDPLKHKVAMWSYFLYFIVGFSALLLASSFFIELEEPVAIFGFIIIFGLIILIVTPIALLLTILRLSWGVEWRLLALFSLTLILVMPLHLHALGIIPDEYAPSWYTVELATVALGLYGVVVPVLVFRYFVTDIWRSQNTRNTTHDV